MDIILIMVFIYIASAIFKKAKKEKELCSNKETGNHVTYNKEPYNKEPYSKGTYNKEPYNKEPYSKGTYNKEPYNKEPYNKEPYNKEPYNKGTYNKDTLNNRTTYASVSTNHPIKKDTPATGKTTVEYLADKAEKIEQGQQRQERENTNIYKESASAKGTRAAERVIDGVSLPQDRRYIKCHYCGADNMLPIGSHEVFTCYFCREVI